MIYAITLDTKGLPFCFSSIIIKRNARKEKAGYPQWPKKPFNNPPFYYNVVVSAPTASVLLGVYSSYTPSSSFLVSHETTTFRYEQGLLNDF